MVSSRRSLSEQLQPLFHIGLDTFPAQIHCRHANSSLNASFPEQFGIYSSSDLKLAAAIGVGSLLAAPNVRLVTWLHRATPLTNNWQSRY